MKLFLEKIQDLQGLYLRELRLLVSAEELIAIKTPYCSERAKDAQLQSVLREQKADAETQAKRLREMFSRAGVEADPLKCKAIYALFDEGEEMVEDAAHESVRDAILISEAQRIKHYEIAAYGAVREFARVLGRAEDERLLNEAIREEGEVDRQLTAIAERVNLAARAA